jgi:hypothetical protein
MKRLGLWAAVAWCLLGSTHARAEGTAQLGANQEVWENTVVDVDILEVGEVINITVGNDSATDPSGIRVRVLDPTGTEVTDNGSGVASPYLVEPGQPGWLQQPDVVPVVGDITNPLQIVTTQIGTYRGLRLPGPVRRHRDPARPGHLGDADRSGQSAWRLWARTLATLGT